MKKYAFIALQRLWGAFAESTSRVWCYLDALPQFYKEESLSSHSFPSNLYYAERECATHINDIIIGYSFPCVEKTLMVAFCLLWGKIRIPNISEHHNEPFAVSIPYCGHSLYHKHQHSETSIKIRTALSKGAVETLKLYKGPRPTE